MIPKKQKTNRKPHSKLFLATSLVIFGCTQVIAQPFNHLQVGQSLVLNDSGTSNQLAAPTPENKSQIFAVPPPPPDTGAPGGRESRDGRGSRVRKIDSQKSSSDSPSETVGDRIQSRSQIFAAQDPPPNIGSPGKREGRGSRGCGMDIVSVVIYLIDLSEIDRQIATIQSAEKLIALVPAVPINDASEVKYVGGFTTAERPTFWFYVDYQTPLTGKFVLRDQKKNLVYEQDVTLPGKTGAIAISLPTTAAPLVAGKQYNWFFKVYCQPGNRLLSFVEGWIQRTSLNSSLESQLQKATLQQKVALYGNNGIWYDALNAAAELRRNNSSDRHWSMLLQDVGLSEIAQETIAAN